MKTYYSVEWPQFYTATIYEWRHLLLQDDFKNIITGSLQFLVTNKRIVLNGFVVMSNHIHLIWQVQQGFTHADVQLSFMKYTSQQMKRLLTKENPAMLEQYKVNKVDRDFQFWKRESLSIELFTPAVFYQKLDYIHNNPVRAGLCNYAEEYYYSSAKFYKDGIDNFGMMTHYAGD